MAKGVFDPKQHYECRIFGHHFSGGQTDVVLPGYFEADTIEQYDPITGNREFAVFKVDDPLTARYPFHWSGTYRIPMVIIKENTPVKID